ncbi:hypothetical protein JRO89_XS03G0148100 [Xanthoceras sorbifolium]|uniref:Retrotransposon gag domain-containing protein n=1 Tax=Xanthoceras sorbifolium TaxID=99658 RepID=A0ABQ8I9Z3_9ROSI|nr:hypothetical protein JRO89_XS03G0148100 [Xanthoceras sorbifolium]
MQNLTAIVEQAINIQRNGIEHTNGARDKMSLVFERENHSSSYGGSDNFRQPARCQRRPQHWEDRIVQEFLDWVDSIESYFDWKEVPQNRKVKLVGAKLRGPASTWWKHYQNDWEIRGKGKVRSWDKMKEKLKAQFLPRDYEEALYQRVQNLWQRDKTVKEYTQEFHRITLRSNLVETETQLEAKLNRGSSKKFGAERSRDAMSKANNSTRGGRATAPIRPNAIGGRATQTRDNTQRQRVIKCYRCKLCNLMIDGGSSENLVSQEMVEKLNLKTIKHPQPYRILWFNKKNEYPWMLATFFLDALGNLIEKQSIMVTKILTFYMGKKKFVLKPMRDDDAAKKGDEFAASLLGLHDFVEESMQSGVFYVLVGKEEMQPQIVSEAVKGLLDEFQDESQSEEQKQNIYSRFYISGRDIAALFIDCGTDSQNCTLVVPINNSQPIVYPTLETAENFYSLIDSFGMEVIVDQIKVPHPHYPSTRVSVQVPNIGIHFSPARYHRLIELLNILYAAMESCGQPTVDNSQAELAPWNLADLATDARVLVWGEELDGLAANTDSMRQNRMSMLCKVLKLQLYNLDYRALSRLDSKQQMIGHEALIIEQTVRERDTRKVTDAGGTKISDANRCGFVGFQVT